MLREPAEVWSRLFLYESRDQATRLWEQRHDREASAGKARDINSTLAQGREYFEAAERAGELVRPLLQYYGVLAMSRGVVLFAEREGREATLSQAHGLQIDGWNGIESGAGAAARLHELSLRPTNGTYLELAKATRNTEREWIESHDLFTFVDVTRPREVNLHGRALPVQQLMQRVPALESLYESCFDDSFACTSASVRLLKGGRIAQIEPYEVRVIQGRMENLVRSWQLGPTARLIQRADQLYPSREPYYVIGVEGETQEATLAALPPLQRVPGSVGVGEMLYVVEPMPDGLVLSPMLTLFALSYFLGMLVRYNPSVWRTMLNREKGDFVYPLMREISNVIRTDYPRLVLEELEARG
jgi:hypothetical protein